MTASKVTIWKLVQKCAENLTEAGQTPFTRGELIRCVRRTNPEYDENSINPIIQGVTDNLKGGAPGAVGKRILHSVGRGQFVLNGYSNRVQSSRTATPTVGHRVKREAAALFSPDKSFMTLGSVIFEFVATIDAVKDTDGTVRPVMPQARYNNKDGLPLNRYGAGPFCKFKISGAYAICGVYVLTVNGAPKYVGECANLSQRFNMGYGNISPRNCFSGGQETNCRINGLLYRSLDLGQAAALWFHRTSDQKAVESALRTELSLEWNRT